MRQVKVGSEDITTYVMLVDEVDGSPKTGIGNTAVTCQYTLNQSTAATQSTGQFLLHPGSSHVDYGFVQVDATNSPGLYRVDWPNTAFASGDQVSLAVTGSGFHPAIETVQLVAADGSDLAAVLEDTIDIQSRIPAALVGGRIDASAGAISADATAADNLEAMLDGTGGVTLSLGQLAIVASSNDDAIIAAGSGTGHGIISTGGSTGIGFEVVGGGTSGDAIKASATDGHGMYLAGGTSNEGFEAVGDGTAAGMTARGGSSGDGLYATSGWNGGEGIYAYGLSVTSDGLKASGGGAGKGIRADEIDDILEDTGTTLPTTLATIDGEVGDILEDTGTTIPARLPSALDGGFIKSKPMAIHDVVAAKLGTLAIGTVNVVTSNTSFTVTGGFSSLDNVYNGRTIVIEDANNSLQRQLGVVKDYVGYEKIVELEIDPGIFTISSTDIVYMLATPHVTAIADAVWDEDLDPAHITAGTAGKAVIDIEVDTAEIGTAGDGLTAVSNQVWSASVHPGSTGTGLKLYDISVDTAEIGTAGDGLTDLGGMSAGMKAEITAQAWDVTASSYTAAGSMGKIMNNMEAEHDDNTLMLQATIAAYSSNTEFIVDSGSTVNDTYLGCTIIIRDASDASVKAVGVISDYLGASKTITLSYDPNPLFTFAIGDSVNIIAVPNKVSPATQTQLIASVWSENSVGYPLPGTFGNILRHLGDDLNSLLLSTTIATYTSQTSFALTAGSSLNGAYVGSTIIITDHNDGEKAVCIVSAYVGVTKTVTLQYNPANTWTFEADDIVNIIAAPSQLHSSIPTTISQSDTATLKSRTPIHPVKNVALANFPFLMVSDVDHVSPVADLSSITAERAIDNGSFSAIASAVSVIGNGMYRVDLSASDMNGDTITLRFSATSADDRLIIVLTQPKE